MKKKNNKIDDASIQATPPPLSQQLTSVVAAHRQHRCWASHLTAPQHCARPARAEKAKLPRQGLGCWWAQAVMPQRFESWVVSCPTGAAPAIIRRCRNVTINY
jgi:hypothetical protein